MENMSKMRTEFQFKGFYIPFCLVGWRLQSSDDSQQFILLLVFIYLHILQGGSIHINLATSHFSDFFSETLHWMSFFPLLSASPVRIPIHDE
jgi:hypothetical protein